MTTVQQIHNEFFTASDRLLAEAKELVKNPQVEKFQLAERLNRIGFGSCKTAKAAQEIALKHSSSQSTIDTIMYFKTKYPNYKFITRDEVDAICRKYNLLLGDCSNYIGEVPEKNLREIEKFKLNKEDFIKDENDKWIRASWGLGAPNLTHLPDGRVMVSYEDGFQSDSKKRQPSFKICAPKKDFDMRGMEIRGNEIVQHIPDPVVLQPVKGGFLIVTAWGDEASDELVVNEKMN